MTAYTDLCKRLRSGDNSYPQANVRGNEAADAIEALQAAVEALRADGERWRMACELFADMGWKANVVVSIRCENEDCPDWHRTPTILRQIDAAIAAQEKL
jgi:hypothetical protein